VKRVAFFYAQFKRRLRDKRETIARIHACTVRRLRRAVAGSCIVVSHMCTFFPANFIYRTTDSNDQEINRACLVARARRRVKIKSRFYEKFEVKILSKWKQPYILDIWNISLFNLPLFKIKIKYFVILVNYKIQKYIFMKCSLFLPTENTRRRKKSNVKYLYKFSNRTRMHRNK